MFVWMFGLQYIFFQIASVEELIQLQPVDFLTFTGESHGKVLDKNMPLICDDLFHIVIGFKSQFGF